MQAQHGSPLVTRRPGERVGFFHEDPILAEREFTRWLTVDNHYFSQGEECRTNDYDSELFAEFVAELPERIAYWLEMRDLLIARNESSFSTEETGGLVWRGETVGTAQIDAYIGRLNWVAQTANDPAFCASCADRFGVVALALKYGPDSARRYWYGACEDWSEETWHELDEARDDLAVQIDEERGAAVMFRPSRPSFRMSAVRGQIL